VEIPRGVGTRDVVRLLHDRGIIQNEPVVLAHLILTGGRGKLRAGEYMFDKPMTVPEVGRKRVSGNIYLPKFNVPQGFKNAAVAQKWEEQGFGKADEFLSAAKESIPLIHDLDGAAQSLEGYLFPETYSFPIRTTAGQAIGAMVDRFRAVVEKLKQKFPP